MQDPPRGGYYPANTTGTTLQPRQYQYSATNPWQREEKERVSLFIKCIFVIVLLSLSYEII